MTQSPAEIELTPEAEVRLGEYLRLVRAALAGSPDVSADEVEADIREHVENELRDRPRPVPRPELEAVLARLGPPTQWLPAGRAAPPPGLSTAGQYVRDRWRAAREAVWRGPEDWRLPYLTLGTFALSVTIFPPLLPVAYILGRAGVTVGRDKGIELGAARKWMLYPPIALVSLALLMAVTVLPPMGMTAIVCGTAGDADRIERRELSGEPTRGRYISDRELMARHPEVVTTVDRALAPFPGNRDVREVLAGGFVGLGALTLWGAVVGLLAAAFPAAVRATFLPLANGFGGRTARRVGLVSLMAFAIWCGVAYRWMRDTGVM